MPVSVVRSAALLCVIGAFTIGCAESTDVQGSPAAQPSRDTQPGTDTESGTSAERAPSTTLEPLVTPDGFDRRAARMTLSDGEVCDLCVWVASSQTQRQQGLMGVTGLGDADAMAFVFEDPERRSFWMKDTVLDLTILFVDADGKVAEVQQMEPCRRDPCPSYRPAEPFVVAVEFGTADAARFGLDSAATFTLIDSDCPEPGPTNSAPVPGG